MEDGRRVTRQATRNYFGFSRLDIATRLMLALGEPGPGAERSSAA